MGSHFFQGIFPPQGSNWCILHWQVILYPCATWEAILVNIQLWRAAGHFSVVWLKFQISLVWPRFVVLLNFASMSLCTKAKLQSENINSCRCLSQQAVFRKVFLLRCRLGYQAAYTAANQLPNLILPCPCLFLLLITFHLASISFL